MKEIKNIGIAGEGKMGTSLFLYLLGYDFRLVWLCSGTGGKDKAMKLAGKKMNILRQSGVMTAQEYALKSGQINITDNPADLKDCDLIIEAIPEDIDLKNTLLRLLDSFINPKCLFTTNSSSIAPSRLDIPDLRKERFAGMHFFFPVNLKKTVELIAGPDTSMGTVMMLGRFLTTIDKNIFHQEEKNAFVLNRLFLDFQAEAYNICREGKMNYRQIDRLVKERFFPSGVFELFDHVGLDVMLASIINYTDKESDKRFYGPLIARLEELIRNNRLGLKTRNGFYEYDRQVMGHNEDPDYVILPNTITEEAERRLKAKFEGSVKKVLDTGGISTADLNEALKDYLGADHDLIGKQMFE